MRPLIIIASALLLAPSALVAQAAAPPSRQELLERDGIVWGSATAWVTPFAENLPDDQKVAGLSRLWMEVKANFPNFARVPELDWDKAFVDYLPRVRATTSTAEYYRVLQQMVALLHDGHTNVFVPKELAARVASPPIVIDAIEHRPFVTGVPSEKLRAQGVVPGLEILAIDEIPVADFVRDRRAPYMSSNSPQHVEVKLYSYGLLEGPREQPVRVTFRRADGKSFSASIARAPYDDVQPLAPVEVRDLPGHMLYVAINTFNSDETEKQFVAALPRLQASNGVVIDARRNDGGSGVIAFDILGYLAKTDVPLPQWKSREYVPTLRAWGTAGKWHVAEKQTWPAKPAEAVLKPVVMLIGPRALSASDVFAESFRLMQRGALVGEATGGSTGDPVAFALPGGGQGRVSTSALVGTDLVGHGVQPTIPAPRTVRDFLAGRDMALEAALAELGKQARHP